MEFLISNWWIILVAVAAIAVLVYMVYRFVKQPTSEQLAKIKEWLLYAVTAAEKELGGGTGQIKLRYVYDMFITKFPALSKIISFNMFSGLVDEVLEQFRGLMDSNTKLETYVEGK